MSYYVESREHRIHTWNFTDARMKIMQSQALPREGLRFQESFQSFTNIFIFVWHCTCDSSRSFCSRNVKPQQQHRYAKQYTHNNETSRMLLETMLQGVEYMSDFRMRELLIFSWNAYSCLITTTVTTTRNTTTFRLKSSTPLLQRIVAKCLNRFESRWRNNLPLLQSC